MRNTDRAVGRCPVADVNIGGVNAHGLIDTGSEVTTVTESWLNAHFPQTKPAYLNWLRLKGAHGLDIPYNGVIEVTLTIGTQTLTDIMVLVDFEGTTEQREQLQFLLNRHRNVFASDDNDLGYTYRVQHRIPVKDDIPVAQPYRTIPPRHFDEVREHIQGLLAKKIIVESHSPYASPIVIVRKKDGTLRLCVDYRRLNAKTVGYAYPFPRIQESFDALVGAQYFTTLDLASRYHQIAMHPTDQPKTAFVTPFGLYEYTRMPFGLATAPATFQRLIHGVMSDFMYNFALVYLDDILVFSVIVTVTNNVLHTFLKIFAVVKCLPCFQIIADTGKLIKNFRITKGTFLHEFCL